MDVIEQIKPFDGILEDDHFVYASGDHGSAWINKDAVTPHASLMRALTADLAMQVARRGVAYDLVVGPAMGGVFVSHWLGLHLDRPSLYFERDVSSADKSFVCHRGYGALIQGAKVLLVDDVINTGFSLEKCVQLVAELGGEVSAVASLINRGNILDDHFSCPLIYLTTYHMPSWPADQCPLCQQGVPVNPHYAHGRDYLAKG